MGIVSGHAYTLLGVYNIKYSMGTEKVVKLRNPWGEQEWKGKWSDGNEIWETVSQGEKERVGYTNNSHDGIFFMTYDDFIGNYSNIELV